MFIGYDPVGKTLHEIAMETEPDHRNGYSVFLLKNKDDPYGKELQLSYSVKAILREHPDVAQWRVHKYNDFLGCAVFRCLPPEENESGTPF